MSQENVETVRRMVDAFNAHGIAGLREFADTEVEFHEPPEQPGAGVARGVEEVMAVFGQFDSAWESHQTEIEEVRAIDGDKVLLVTLEHFVGRDGLEVDAPHASVMTLRDGRMVRWQAFWDRERALEAAAAAGNAPSANTGSNVDLVRELYDAINRRDLEALGRAISADFTWYPNEDDPEQQVRVGPEQVFAFARGLFDALRQLNTEVEEALEAGDRVVAMVRHRALAAGSDVPIERREAHVVTFRDGLATSLHEFPTREEALRVAGIELGGAG